VTASLPLVARAWTRIGVTGFGGPPAHIALLRELVVERHGWLDARAFEDANAACGLLPGPASTQLAIFCAYRVAGPAGAVVGGLGFVAPAVVLVLALSALFLASSPPDWVQGAGLAAGAAAAAVAAHAARTLLVPSFDRVRGDRAATLRWAAYVAAGLVATVLAGPWLVLVLLGCGLAERGVVLGRRALAAAAPFPVAAASTGGLGALAWTALKVGALSFGGGFVIIPLMQGDAVHVHHWMTDDQFLDAVALGQVTPGPVVATVAAVGYGAHGLAGGLLAAAVAFAPSFTFVLVGGGRFERLRTSPAAQAFLAGSGPAAIGAIGGAAVLLGLAIDHGWQAAVLAAALVALFVARRGVVSTLVVAGVVGALAGLAGASL
jgi:chromate transporter